MKVIRSNCSISGVEKGYEVIMTYDGGSNKIGRLGINTGRLQVLQEIRISRRRSRQLKC